MKPGDRVTFVGGLPGYYEGNRQPCTVVRLLPDAKVLIETHPGIQFTVRRHHLDDGQVAVAPHRHRAADPDTARAAAERTAEQLREHHWLVLSAIAAAGSRGMIDHEHESVNGLNQDSAGKRRGELVEWGLVERTEMRRQTVRGRMAIVWRVTGRGVSVFQQYRGAA